MQVLDTLDNKYSPTCWFIYIHCFSRSAKNKKQISVVSVIGEFVFECSKWGVNIPGNG